MSDNTDRLEERLLRLAGGDPSLRELASAILLREALTEKKQHTHEAAQLVRKHAAYLEHLELLKTLEAEFWERKTSTKKADNDNEYLCSLADGLVGKSVKLPRQPIEYPPEAIALLREWAAYLETKAADA